MLTSKEKQALNEKIAKWRGFTWTDVADSNDKIVAYPDYDKNNPTLYLRLPNFCDSMDEHIEWTVPKLASLGWLTRVQYGNHTYEGAYGNSILLRKDGKPTAYAELYYTRYDKPSFTQRNFYGLADTMTEALSLAIEKLIDTGIK